MTDLSLIELEYNSSLVDCYQKLARLPGFILLESTNQTLGRYDIVSAFPYDQISVQSEEDYEAIQEHLKAHHLPVDLPFQGGLMGYFSYDFAAQLAGINLPQQPGLQKIPSAQLGAYDWAIIADHQLKKVHLFSANSQPDTKQIIHEILIIWHGPKQAIQDFQLAGQFTPLISQDNYRESFEFIHRDIRAGRAYQVNYTQAFHAPFEGDSWQMYRRLRDKNPVPYAAFMRLDGAEVLSLSPERFLMMDGHDLLTSPIKGTIGRAKAKEEDHNLARRLLASEKNRAENLMIVDLLRNDLGKIAVPGSVRPRALCELESHPAVHHLVSHIEARLSDRFNAFQAFLSCFPGGSITGAPKLEAMRIIAEHEPFARGIYCGSLGYFSKHGRFDTNIAIRTVTATENLLHLAAGGGIVIDSAWKDEYLECFTKIEGIIRGLH